MVYTFHCAHSHLEMQLNDIIIVSVMVSDTYTITDTNPILPKMADTDLSIYCMMKKKKNLFIIYGCGYK